jgi:hypothetical protein
LNSFFGSRDRRGAVHGAFEGGGASWAGVGEGEGTGDQVNSDVFTLAAHGAFEGGSDSGAGTGEGEGEAEGEEGAGDQPSCSGKTFMKSFCPFLQ